MLTWATLAVAPSLGERAGQRRQRRNASSWPWVMQMSALWASISVGAAELPCACARIEHTGDPTYRISLFDLAPPTYHAHACVTPSSPCHHHRALSAAPATLGGVAPISVLKVFCTFLCVLSLLVLCGAMAVQGEARPLLLRQRCRPPHLRLPTPAKALQLPAPRA